MRGYTEAGKIDKQVSNLLKKNPITGNTEVLCEWMLFSRTLRTTLDLLDTVIDANLKKGIS